MVQVENVEQLQQDWELWTNERDDQACTRLIEAYFPLVEYHVQRIGANVPKSVKHDDLRSHGFMGLYDALEKFDTSRDLKFDTYASFRIRGSIMDGLRQEDWLPRSVREKSKKIEATIERLEQEQGRNIEAKEIAEELGMSETDILHVMNETFVANVLSIDEPAQESDRDETYLSTIEDKKTLTPEQEIVKQSSNDELVNVIDNLNEKERLVITLFYFEELTLTEIGEVLSLSTSRISQIHSKALFRLQQVLKKAN
ncbi:FliA/WhiG family RNA polymerase sigma factor [Texcoconibacillus texcoconensis]|uniref:RNA polymerase sigma factor for flagellar operon FliA n=1 Tax=Texcoconibacillus texcoconensis TaxID=1095777 RepID=A0A840QL25_9BACI|nr:FliA/WhiG family RNA polymerase sigma factor [Texcoconibacillus texcoconensis]MBB5172051.1 RNA polymerase sigma factor for flagellar operon FliA [Texcoconibacillus texcoconensis]